MADPIRAVEYVRMSSEGQQLSIPFQQAAIRLHAAQRSYEIVRTYEDAACSGLYIEGRPSLKRLLDEVQSGQADFKAILVYDVSRWGRFPDTDEGGYYEYLCRKAGVQVVYCAEPFPADSGPLTAVLKAIKRAMAAEFSRELSVKVHSAMTRLAVRGYLPGGPPGYGWRRMLVGNDGQRKGILEAGVYKPARTDRVILVPGPEREIETVHRIYRLFLEDRLGHRTIAAILNSEAAPFSNGRRWTQHSVRHVLQSERHVGTIVFNRTSSRFRKGLTDRGRVKNDPSEWVRGTFPEAIVPHEQFMRVKQMPNLRGLIYRDEEELLAPLRSLLQEYGHLSSTLIKYRPGVPSPATLRARFGSIRKAFARVGYACRYAPEKNLSVRVKALELAKRIVAAVEARGHAVIWRDRRKPVTLESGKTLTVSIAHFAPTLRPPALRWAAPTGHRNHPDYIVVARSDQSGERTIDYYYLPGKVVKRWYTFLDGGPLYACYRCTSFENLIETLLSRR